MKYRFLIISLKNYKIEALTYQKLLKIVIHSIVLICFNVELGWDVQHPPKNQDSSLIYSIKMIVLLHLEELFSPSGHTKHE